MPHGSSAGRFPSGPRLALSTCLLGAWALLLPAGGAQAPAPPLLAPGAAVARALQGGERHRYGVAASQSPRLVTVEQLGIDVALSAGAAAASDGGVRGGGRGSGRGAAPITVDTAGSRWGTESLLLPPGPPAWSVEVAAAAQGAPAGRYEIRIETLPTATAEERDRVQGERLFTDAGAGERQGTAETLRAAIASAGQALDVWRRLGRTREQGRALDLLAILEYRTGGSAAAEALSRQAAAIWRAAAEPRSAADALALAGLAAWAQGDDTGALAQSQSALEIFRAQDERWGEAVTLDNVCLIRHTRGEWREAVPCYQEALRLLRDSGDPAAETSALINLGGVYDLLGEPQRALDAYDQALARARRSGDRGREAQCLNNLAVVYLDLGEGGAAIVQYRRALALFRAIGDRRGEARALSNLGAALRRTGDPRQAGAPLAQALELRRAIGDRRGEAATLDNLGRARQDLGDVAGALTLYRQSLQVARAIGDRRGEAAAQTRIGAALSRAGDADEAVAALDAALAMRRDLADRPGEAETLTDLAAAERALARLAQARAHLGEALDLIDQERARIGDPDLRATYLAAQQRAFELAIGLESQLAAQAPDAGHAEAAFTLAERARARSLLDLLQESRADVRQGVDPRLRQRERDVADRLSAAATRRMELPAGAAAAPRRAAAEEELTALLAESAQVEAELRRASPRYATLTRPRPLDAAAIRRLLPPDTLLLEYSLGEEKSFLYAVTARKVELHELPPRRQLDALARRACSELSTDAVGRRAASTGATATADLGKAVLGPLAGPLADRLVIVADGALQYIPFAALPEPGDPAHRLIERHEIAYLPSASLLSADRTDRPASTDRTDRPASADRPALAAARRAPTAVLAVMADPVFSARDPRLAAASAAPVDQAAAPPHEAAASSEPGWRGSAGRSAGRQAAATELSRLPATRREAAAIAALLPPGASDQFLGFDASRGAVVGGRLAPYRIVHFATHGVLAAETPRLSGLMLSRFDRQGRPVDGFLSLTDVYNLDLSADLVVLSGCDTALGREVRGEGLIGLVRGFLYAGAKTVAASLWPQQDRATADLMTRFYRAMLEHGKTPAAALREAQIAELRTGPWRQPCFWAGFVVEGDRR